MTKKKSTEGRLGSSKGQLKVWYSVLVQSSYVKVCRTCLINPVWLTSFKDQKHFCWPLSLFNPLICRWLENFYILNTFWYWQSKLCWSLSMIPINIDSCQIKRLLSFISVTLASTSHNWQLNMDFPNKHIFGDKSTESGALKIIKTI